MSQPTFTDRVAALFRSRPNELVNYRDLASVGGFGGWRTRISECRFRGMRIENRWRVLPSGARVSEYKFTPKTEQLPLIERVS